MPAHSAVSDATVNTWLGLAAQRHNAAAWGAVYPSAMVWWAAHRIERLPGSGAGAVGGDAGTVGVITSQRDGDLSRTYASPTTSAGATGADAEFSLSRYGQMYLELRDSRAATKPTAIGPGSALWPGTVL